MRPRSLPPLQLVFRSVGRPEIVTTVTGLTDTDRVGDLVLAVGLQVGEAVLVDGARVPTGRRLVTSPVRRGSLIEDEPQARVEPVPGGPGVTVEWCAGPDSGRRVRLGPGRHLLGRRPGLALVASDPRLSTHHGLVVVEREGEMTYQDLHGATSAVDHRLVAEPVVLRPGGHLRVGTGLLRMLAGDATADLHDPAGRCPGVRPPGRHLNAWTDPLARPPRRVPPAGSSPVTVPEPLAASAGDTAGAGVTTLVTAALSTLGALVMMLVVGRGVMAIMALVGAATAFGAWLVQSVRVRRARRSEERRRSLRLAEIRAALESARTVEAARLAGLEGLAGSAVAASSGIGLWERRLAHPDALEVVVGFGDRRWQPVVVGRGTGHRLDDDADVAVIVEALASLDHVAATGRLRTGGALGIVGPPELRAALARSVLIQLATNHGPADVRIAIVTGPGDRTSWEWTSWLAHVVGPESSPVCGELRTVEEWAAGLLAASGSPGATSAASRAANADSRYRPVERMNVVVVDDPGALAIRTSALRRLLLAPHCPATFVVLAPTLGELPSVCGEAIEITDDATAVHHRWLAEAGETRSGVGIPGERFRIAGATVGFADEVARRTARFDDPERLDPLGSLPAEVDLDELLGERIATPSAIAAGWRAAGADPPPRALIGVAGDGAVEIDLCRDGPHALIGGTTGAGKSELLRTLVAAMAVDSPPELLSFVLIDYKGGAAFDACARLPHVVGIVTDLDDRLAARVLVSLDAELRRREHLLRAGGAADLTTYRTSANREPMPRLVVVVDEFAALAAEQPEFLGALVSVAQRGRSLGLHLVLATQRPHGVIGDDIRANTNLRIALRVQDRADSLDVVGDPLAAQLSRSRPGSAVLRLDADELTVFQTARCTGPVPSGGGTTASGALDVLVERFVRAAALVGGEGPTRPWLDPLGHSIEAYGPDQPPETVGVVDVPELQSREPLVWKRGLGHLLIAGSLGSGTTTALATVAMALAEANHPADLHFYALDAAGSGGLDHLADLPHCAGVVGGADVERCSRLLRRLATEIVRRRAAATETGRPAIVLAIDGLATLRASLDTSAGLADAERLSTILHDGPRVGVVTMAATDRPGDVPAAVVARAGARWMFGLVDPMEAAVWGISPRAAVPHGRPGRCVRVETGHEAQILLDPRPAAQAVQTIVERHRGRVVGPNPLGSLPATITVGDLTQHSHRELDIDGSGALVLSLGLGVDTLEPVDVTLHRGEHLLVAGPARSGRSTTLGAIIEVWRVQRPSGWIGVVRPRASGGGAGIAAEIAAEIPVDLVGGLAEVVGEAAGLGARPGLIVIDDAESVDDDGALAALLAGPCGMLHVVAAGRPEALRSAYGHWTAVIRRSRKGVLLGSLHDVDADILGATLPRHRPARPPGGRGYVVADGQIHAALLALPSTTRMRRAA